MREIASFDGAAHRARRGRGPGHRRRTAAATPTSSRPGRPRRRTPRSPGCSSAARETGARVHVVHLSSAAALPLLAAARADGVPVTVETCPHYLALTAEEVPDGDTRFKCCPPVREAANRDALWQGLADGVIDMVVSDHSPCTPELKRLDTGDFGAGLGRHRVAAARRCPSSGREARAARPRARRRRPVDGDARPPRWSGSPARAASPPGPTPTWWCSPRTRRSTVGELHHRHPLTPYAGRELHRGRARHLAARPPGRRRSARAELRPVGRRTGHDRETD